METLKGFQGFWEILNIIRKVLNIQKLSLMEEFWFFGFLPN